MLQAFRQIFLKKGALWAVLLACILSSGSLHARTINWAPFFYKPRVTKAQKEAQDPQVKSFTALGPIAEQKPFEGRKMEAFRPLFMRWRGGPVRGNYSFVAYPFFSQYRDRYTHRVNMFNLVQSREVAIPGRPPIRSFMFFPFVFYKDTGYESSSYAGFFPVKGMVRNFFNQDKIEWFLFPGAIAREKNGVRRTAFIWPFFKNQTGPKAGGGGVWPLFQHYWQEGKNKEMYAFWPLCYQVKEDLDTDYPTLKEGFLPFFAIEDRKNKYSIHVIWPFFGYMDLKDPDYHEDRIFWPFVIKGRGTEQFRNRFAPFYSHSIFHGVDKKWYTWPLFKVQRWEQDGLAIDQQQFVFFFWWRQRQRSLENPDLPCAEKSHVWPLASYWNDGAGHVQFQMLSPFEVFFPTNKVVREMYSPIFAVWRYAENGPQNWDFSLAFRTVSVEKREDYAHFSLGPLVETQTGKHRGFQVLKGLFGYMEKEDETVYRFLWFKIRKKNKDKNKQAPQAIAQDSEPQPAA